jgi:ATP-binding cassette subfamily B protein/subfamily B ATP-binding cassette protein MsbA
MRSAGQRRFRGQRRYGRLLAYPLRRRGGWSAIVVVTILSTLSGLLAPLPLKVLVDDVLGRHRAPGIMAWLPGTGSRHGLLAWVVVAEVLVFLISSAVEVASTFLWTVVGQGTVFDLARDVFARLQRRSLSEHLREPVGDMIERVAGDSWSVHTVLDELVLTPLSALAAIAAVTVVMVALDPGLTIIALITAPVMAVVPVLLGRPIRSVGEAQRQIQGEIYAHVQQTLAGIPVVQAFGQEARQHEVFQQLARAAVRLQTRGALLGGLGGLGSGLIAALGTGIVLLLGAHAVIDHHLTVGGLLVFASYLGVLQGQFGGLTGIYSALQSARPSIDRVVEVLDRPVEEVEDVVGGFGVGGRVRGEVVVDGVWFGYERSRPVLRGVSFSAAPGEVVAVVGPTGAGKSTLVGLVPRFFDPDRGGVLLDGRDLRGLPLGLVRGSVGLVLQESFLFPFSVAENIAYGRPGASFEEVCEAARVAGADEFIRGLPEGYGTVLGERGATLSGGERQRIAIARAVLKDAPVLILDEPTSALDAETEAVVLEALSRLMEGRTTIIIAHRLSTVRAADQILVLREGEVVERGTHRELLALEGHYTRLHQAQHGSAT